MNRRLIVALTAGATLTVAAGCRKEAVPEPTMTHNPPAPDPEPVLVTNPPMPVLLVSPDGRCFEGGETAEGKKGPHVADCPGNTCGPSIPCPPEAEVLLTAFRERDLPEWRSVPSTHPKGATNPPRPILIVDPNGRCYHKWVGGMMAPTPETSDGVRVCAGEEHGCGTEVRCNDEARAMLAEWKAEHP